MKLTEEELVELMETAQAKSDSYGDQCQRCEEADIAYWNNLSKLWGSIAEKAHAALRDQ